MIKIICLCAIIVFQSCLDMVVRKNIMDFRMNDSTLIMLQYTGGGATAPDHLVILKRNLTHSTHSVIKVLDGFDDRYIFHFQKMNDLMLLFNMVDTALFAGGNRNLKFRLNINQVDTTLNQYK